MFGTALKEFRKQQKLSLDGLADRLKVSRGTIVNWENGVSSPSFDTCKALHSMGMNFISLLKSPEDIKLDKKDAGSLAGKLERIIELELNQRVYGLNLLDKLDDDNRKKVNDIVQKICALPVEKQRTFLDQLESDLDAYSHLHEKYDIRTKKS